MYCLCYRETSRFVTPRDFEMMNVESETQDHLLASPETMASHQPSDGIILAGDREGTNTRRVVLELRDYEIICLLDGTMCWNLLKISYSGSCDNWKITSMSLTNTVQLLVASRKESRLCCRVAVGCTPSLFRISPQIDPLNYVAEPIGSCPGRRGRTAHECLVSLPFMVAVRLPVYAFRMQARLLHVVDMCHEAVTQGVIITKRHVAI